MKTSELSGPQLDYWVAKLEEIERRPKTLEAYDDVPALTIENMWYKGSKLLGCFDYEPSKSWSQGGPIIERERIQLMPWKAELRHIASWTGKTLDGWQGEGHTPLIAAMRAYVASKLGEEVPDSEA